MEIIQSLGARHISQCLHLDHLLTRSGEGMDVCLHQDTAALPADSEVKLKSAVVEGDAFST